MREGQAVADAKAPGALGVAGVALLLALFLIVGGIGLDRYLRNFWLYRGFSPPVDPAFVTQKGTVETIKVTSPALGGRSQQVIVYLPPGYASHPHRRYPVF